jgi:predicted TIM-barrel enzyme
MSWLQDVFGTDKAIIGMCHMLPLPGDPHYDAKKGMGYVVDMCRRDLSALQEGGVDAVMFANEFSLPYLTDVATETVAAMARVIGELMGDIRIPFGVNVLWDARKSLDLAAATGACFVREIFTGVYASDFGPLEHRRGRDGCDTGAMLSQKTCGFSSTSFPKRRAIWRTATSRASPGPPCSTTARPLCVSGLVAGAETDSSVLKRVKDAVPQTVCWRTQACAWTTWRSSSPPRTVPWWNNLQKDGVFENPVTPRGYVSSWSGCAPSARGLRLPTSPERAHAMKLRRPSSLPRRAPAKDPGEHHSPGEARKSSSSRGS